MVEQGLVAQPIFSFYLLKGTNGTKGGEVIFGGSDRSKYSGNMTYAPVIQQAYWKIKMTRVVVGKNILCAGGCETVVDTGNSRIFAPAAEAEMLNQALGGVEKDGRYVFDCKARAQLPKIGFVIAGKRFYITGSDYLVNVRIGKL